MVNLLNYQMLQLQVQQMLVQQYHTSGKSSPNANFSADVTTIVGANNQDYTPGLLSETTYFRRLAVSELNLKTCTSTTDIVEVEVKDGPGGTLTS